MNNRPFLLVFLLTLISSLFCEAPMPAIFKDSKWYDLGEERNVIATGKLDIENTNWNFPVFGRLIFLQGHYAYGTPWSGIESFGNYSIIDKKVLLKPALIIPRWDDRYSVSELHFTTSNRVDDLGNQLLIDSDDTITFYGWKYPLEPQFIVINKVPCKKVSIPIRLLENNHLFTLPNPSSKNIFDKDNYYGNLAVIGKSHIVYEPLNTQNEWVYVRIDLTSGEPTDGGGPYYYGWVKRNVTSEVINHNMITVSDNLRLRSDPNIVENVKIITKLKKWTVVKIIKVGDFIETINDIEDRWYQVSLDDGTVGWIFGGFAKQFDNDKELEQLKERYKNF